MWMLVSKKPIQQYSYFHFACLSVSFVAIFLSSSFVYAAGSNRISTKCTLYKNADIYFKVLTPNVSKTQLGYQKANQGHQIIKGDSSVLAIRIVEDDNAGVDSQVISKITLVLNNYQNFNSVSYRVKKSYFITGGIGFIDKGWYAINHNGV